MHTVEISSDKTYFVRKRKYSNAIILDAFNMKQENTSLLSLFYFSFHWKFHSRVGHQNSLSFSNSFYKASLNHSMGV